MVLDIEIDILGNYWNLLYIECLCMIWVSVYMWGPVGYVLFIFIN